jgi:hypothetical protein
MFSIRYTYTLLAGITGVAGTTGAFALLNDPVLSDDDAIAFSAILGGLPAPPHARQSGGSLPPPIRSNCWRKPAHTRPARPSPRDGQASTCSRSFRMAVRFSPPRWHRAKAAPRRPTQPARGALTRMQPDTAFPDGDGIGNKTVKSFTMLSAVAGSTGVTRSFNSIGTVVWLATFTDNTTAIVATEIS